jgi:hypothetical protein
MRLMVKPRRPVILSLVAVALLGLAAIPLVRHALSAPPPPPITFADPAFARVWSRTEGPLMQGTVTRSWMWGPTSWAMGREPYQEGAGGERVVQYFDKGRMEISNPASDHTAASYVTSGLLVVEMVRGAVALGDTRSRLSAPAAEPVAGDPRPQNPDAPDYGSFRPVASLDGDHEAPDRTGQPVDATLSRAGAVGRNPTLGEFAQAAYYNDVPGLRHNIPDVFWSVLNAPGLLLEDGQPTQGQVLNWLFSVGYQITEPYWIRARVGGTDHDILVQLFQRRVLTLDPTAPPGWQVQMGNVGQHYYRWRYEQATSTERLAPLSTALPRYALDTVWQSDPPLLNAAATAGAGLVRMGVAWSAVEPEKTTPDHFHWEAYDDALKRANAAGLSVLAGINDCPPWACEYPEGPLDRASPADMAVFMRAMVERYSGPPYDVHLWELFNEPDSTRSPHSGWGLYGKDYATMLSVVVPGIRAADPQAKIFLGGLAYDWFFTDNGGPFNQHFLADMLPTGAPYFDYVNFHYYPQNIHWATIGPKVAEIQGILAAAGVQKPIVCTETDLTSSTDGGYRIPRLPPNDQSTQARWLVQVHAQGFAAGLDMITWFPARDFQTDVPGWQVFTEGGLLRQDGGPKPALLAYQGFVREVGNAPATRSLTPADLHTPGVEAYEFARPDGRLWIAWKDWTDPVERSIPLPSPNTVVRDMYGRLLPFSPRVTIGADPIYVEIH